MEHCDVLIVGAGPGGLAAAKSARESGADRVLVLERNTYAGGILNQCIHDGFGLVRYGVQLSGPEYADRARREALAAGASIQTGNQVVRISKERVVTAVSPAGLRTIKAGVVILATGCRERTRGAISIPGTRPAGVFTAGVVQNLVNIGNVMPGKQVVVLGSGDIGLIMARRLTLEGAVVKAVVEVMPEPGGLARNISQCLYDLNIPILVKHTVSRIIGSKRLIGVEISQVDDQMNVIPGTACHLSCDALILSVGLIPENEVALAAGVEMDPRTNGALTDDFLQTSVPGIFSCGNSRQVMDLADYVSEQGGAAGENAVRFLRGSEMRAWGGPSGATIAKGIPAPNIVTCTLCPNGCQVRWNEEAQAFEGNRCPRGEEFAWQERRAPKRTLTTTVRVEGGSRPLVSVRTSAAVDRDKLLTLSKRLREVTAQAPVEIGQVLCEFPEGVQVIATGRNPRGDKTHEEPV